MLRISKLADYSTVVMVYLARTDKLANAKEIAHFTHLTVPTVSKILKALTQAGLLVSLRGASGGYRLKRLPQEISVAEILFALEEKRGLTECSVHGSLCAFESVCVVKGNWRLISVAIEAALQNLSLAALAAPSLDTRALSNIQFYINRGTCCE